MTKLTMTRITPQERIGIRPFSKYEEKLISVWAHLSRGSQIHGLTHYQKDPRLQRVMQEAMERKDKGTHDWSWIELS